MSDDINISWKIYFLTSVLVKLPFCYNSAPAFRLRALSQDPVARLTGYFLMPRHSLESVHHPISPFTFLKQSFSHLRPSWNISCHLISQVALSPVLLGPTTSHSIVGKAVLLCPVLISYHLTILSPFCYALKLEASWSSEIFVKFYHITRCNILGGAFPHSHENFMSYAMGDI